MKLYNQNVDIVGKYTTINTVDGVLYPNKLTDEQLNSYGYYKVEYGTMPNRRYYTAIPSRSLVGNKFVIGYTADEKPLDEVKASMFKDFFEYADKREDRLEVQTSTGHTVKGNASALQAFTIGAKRGETLIRDKNYKPYTVTVPQMTQIYNEIEDNASAFFALKGNEFDKIDALQTVADCIAYENAPYDYIVTQADVDFESNLTVGQVIVRYKNQVKEW